MATATVSASSPSRGLSIALWIVQVLLAAMFLMAGAMKATQPLDALVANMSFVGYTPGPVVRFIGISEVLGAIGLVLPAATRIQPYLTPLAAGGLATIMALAFGTHALHAEWSAMPVNVVLGALAAFVAWGRSTKAPIAGR